jgi:hypothetical protein
MDRIVLEYVESTSPLLIIFQPQHKRMHRIWKGLGFRETSTGHTNNLNIRGCTLYGRV